jgi:hypothetical protein
VICDGGEALGESSRFHRAVVLLDDEKGVGKTLVVLDEVQLSSPEKAHLFWHTGGTIELDETKHTGLIRGRKANLHFAITSTAPITSRTGSKKLSYGCEDRFMRITVGLVGPTYFLSVFGKKESKAKPEIQIGEKGSVRVRLGQAVLNFQSTKRGLAYCPVEKK